MQLTATLQLSHPALRNARVARPVKAFSAGSAYLGRRMECSKLLGVPQLPSHRRAAAGAGAQPVQASFLGVGAPEAILVGVVALVVFGPKGLAQAAKSLGSTLRSFAPTIREITSVSQELKSTLEQEIGINEIRDELTRPAVPAPRPAQPMADVASSTDTSEQQGAALSELATSMQQQQGPRTIDDKMASILDPEIERKRAEAAAAAWGGAAPAAAAPAAATAAAAATGAQPAPVQAQAAAPAGASSGGAAAPAAAAAAAAAPRAVESMSLEELEAELARRKTAISAGQLPKQLSADD